MTVSLPRVAPAATRTTGMWGCLASARPVVRAPLMRCPNGWATTPRVRALAVDGEIAWRGGQERPLACHAVPTAPTGDGAARAHTMSGGIARDVPGSADGCDDSLWCLPRLIAATADAGPGASAAPSINPTGDRRNVGVEARERRRVAWSEGAFVVVLRVGWSGRDVHATRPPFDPGSPKRRRRGGGWSRAPTGWWGPFSHGRGLDVTRRVGQMSITFERNLGNKKGDRLVALVLASLDAVRYRKCDCTREGGRDAVAAARHVAEAGLAPRTACVICRA